MRTEVSPEEARVLVERATLKLQQVNRSLKMLQMAQHEPIAVVGMACRFPGQANSPEAFWQLLHAGRDAIGDVTARWQALGHTPGSDTPRWAALIDRVDTFDADFFGISPREAAKLDPQQRVLLEMTWEALERAGIPPERLMGSRTGVFIGQTGHDYEHATVQAGQEADVYAVTGNLHAFSAGRIAYALGLQGPAVCLDTACSSSLSALHLACQSLRNGESDVVIAGATSLLLTPIMMDMMRQTGALAPDGRCKTFDARANGYVRGEGCGVVVLKRISDALRDEDPVLATVRGSAVNQDGASSGLTAPNVTAQIALLQQALASAQVQPDELDYIEAHGTGTSLGDPIEMEALRTVLGAPRGDGRVLRVGSVKTQVGHLEAAAGMAGLFKVILAMQHGTLPGNLHFRSLNPMIRLEGTALQVASQPAAWPRSERPRLAGVSGFALSGTNAHVIVEEPPALAEPAPAGSPRLRLLPLSARHPEALKQVAERMVGFLQGDAARDQDVDIAYTAAMRRSHHPLRLVVQGEDRAAWTAGLQAYLRGEAHPSLVTAEAVKTPQRLPVWVFPGQGGQWLGMGRGLFAAEPAFAAAFKAADAAVQQHGQFSLIAEMYAATPRLDAIEVVQPWLFCMQVSLAALWRSYGVQPGAVVGHSMGEVAAAVVAEAISLDAGAQIICQRSRLMRQVAGQGAMLAVNLRPEEAKARMAPFGDAMGIAVFSGPQSLVISGERQAVETLQQQLQGEGLFAARVQADVAAHSPVMEPLMAPLQSALAALPVQMPKVPLYSTVLGERLTTPQDAAYWARNLRQPVLFGAAVQQLLQDDYDTFIEMSPHPVLSNTLQAMGGVALGSTRRDQPEQPTFLAQLASLYTGGHRIDWAAQYPHGGRMAPLPTYPFLPTRHWLPARPAATLGGRRGAKAHPVLEAPVALANGTRAWEGTLSLETHPWLQDHRVGEAVVVPGALFVDCLLVAGGPHLRNVQLHEMLVVPAEGALLMQVVREASGALLLCSRRDDAWVTHATAHVDSAPPSGERATEATDGAGLEPSGIYRQLACADLHYGPAFQTLQRAWLQRDAAQGHLQPPERQGFALPPTLLDGALQLGGLHGIAAQGQDTQAPWVPVAVEHLALLGDPTGGVRCWARRHGGGDGWRGDIGIHDADGQPVALLRGVRMQQLSAAHPGARVLLAHSWESLPALADPGEARGTWLIVGDSSGLGLALQKGLAERGGDVVYVPPRTDAAAHVQDAVPLRGVVYLAALDAPGGAEGLAQAQALACDGPVRLANGLLQRRWRDMPRVWWVTRGAVQVADEPEPVQPQQGLLWGLARCMAYEAPQLRGTRIDVRGSAGGLANQADVADALLRELLANPGEDELALRGTQRLAARLVRNLPAPVGPAPALRQDGTYLITGGLGGLGLEVAAWLAKQGAGHLLLLSRRPAQSPAQHATVAALQAAGARVHVVQADVVDRTQLAAVIARTQGGDLPPLRGVVHTAGLLDDAVLAEQTPERMQRVLAPKVLGAWHLHTLTEQAPLDLFVLYSSVAGLMGSAGQSNYAAANTFLDSLAMLRRQQGKPALSVDWGPFADVGLAAAEDLRGNRLASRGMRSLTPAEGTQLLAALLSLPVAHAAAVHLDARQWLQAFPQLTAGSLLRQLGRDAKGDGPEGNFRARLQQASPEAREALLLGFIKQQIAAVLRLEPERIKREAPLKSLGIDSLLGLELRNRLEQGLGLRLSATLVWVHPTLDALHKFLQHALRETDDVVAAAEVAPSQPAVQVQKSADSAGDSEADLAAVLEAELALGAKLGVSDD